MVSIMVFSFLIRMLDAFPIVGDDPFELLGGIGSFSLVVVGAVFLVIVFFVKDRMNITLVYRLSLPVMIGGLIALALVFGERGLARMDVVTVSATQIFATFAFSLAGALLFDRPRVGYLRALATKGAVSAVCNLFLNTLWISMTGGKAMMVLLPARALKNLGLLPIEALLLYMTAAALTVVLKRAGVQRGVRE